MTLKDATPEKLVATLKHDNMFWRRHAQRLLVERGKLDVVPALVKLVDDPTCRCDRPERRRHSCAVDAARAGRSRRSEQPMQQRVGDRARCEHHSPPACAATRVQVLPRHGDRSRRILDSESARTIPTRRFGSRRFWPWRRCRPREQAGQAIVGSLIASRQPQRPLASRRRSPAAAANTIAPSCRRSCADTKPHAPSVTGSRRHRRRALRPRRPGESRAGCWTRSPTVEPATAADDRSRRCLPRLAKGWRKTSATLTAETEQDPWPAARRRCRAAKQGSLMQARARLGSKAFAKQLAESRQGAAGHGRRRRSADRRPRARRRRQVVELSPPTTRPSRRLLDADHAAHVAAARRRAHRRPRRQPGADVGATLVKKLPGLSPDGRATAGAARPAWPARIDARLARRPRQGHRSSSPSCRSIRNRPSPTIPTRRSPSGPASCSNAAAACPAPIARRCIEQLAAAHDEDRRPGGRQARLQEALRRLPHPLRRRHQDRPRPHRHGGPSQGRAARRRSSTPAAASRATIRVYQVVDRGRQGDERPARLGIEDVASSSTTAEGKKHVAPAREHRASSSPRPSR